MKILEQDMLCKENKRNMFITAERAKGELMHIPSNKNY